MQKLSRQQKIIVEALRSKDWVCGSMWLGLIKDDRARITSLNRGYMKEHGWEINGKPCDGRCGKTHASGLYMRRAERINASQAIVAPSGGLPATLKAMEYYWNSIPSRI